MLQAVEATNPWRRPCSFGAKSGPALVPFHLQGLGGPNLKFYRFEQCSKIESNVRNDFSKEKCHNQIFQIISNLKEYS